MADDPRANARLRGFRPLGGIGGRAAAATLRPFTDVAAVELETVLATALESEHVQRGLRGAFESDGGRQLVADFFDSPAVTAAITQQGLGFADQMGEEVRSRTRRMDDWLEHAANSPAPVKAAVRPPL